MTGAPVKGLAIRERLASAGCWAGAACAVAVLLVVAGKISPLANVPKWDEFIYLYDSQRVLSGQVPYRDFFQFTPPGDLFFLAGWFRLFSGAASVTWGRYLSAATALVSWLWLWRSLRRAGWGPRLAPALASLTPLCLYTFWPIPSHHWFAGLFFLGAFEAFDFETRRVRGRRGWFWVGACGGAAFLFLQTAAAAMAAFWGVFWALGTRGRDKAHSSAWGGLGCLAVLVPTLGWFWINGALGSLFRDVFLWTAGHYRTAGGANAVPLLQDLPSRLAALWAPPGDLSPLRWAPLAAAGTMVHAGILGAVCLVGLLWARGAAALLRRRSFASPLAAALMALSVVEFSLFLMGKPDWLHLVYAMARVGPAWLLLGPPAAPASSGWRTASGWLLGVFAASGLLFGAGWMLLRTPAAWEFTDADRPVREAPVNRYLRAQDWLLPGDTIAAFPEGGEVYLYVRPAAIGFTLLYPPGERYHGSEDYEIAAGEILANGPRCIVMTSDTESQYLSADCALSGPIRERYRFWASVGDAVIYRLEPRP